MGITTATIAAVAGAVYGASQARQAGNQNYQMLKAQYLTDSYNAQMDKIEKEVDLAKQEKLLQKQLAETMAQQNNLFGESGLEGSTGYLVRGSYLEGVEETRDLQAQAQYVQNKFISTSALRRADFLRNVKVNDRNTRDNMLIQGIQGAIQGWQIGSSISGGGSPVKRDVTGTAGTGGNVRFTNASYKG